MNDGQLENPTSEVYINTFGRIMKLLALLRIVRAGRTTPVNFNCYRKGMPRYVAAAGCPSHDTFLQHGNGTICHDAQMPTLANQLQHEFAMVAVARLATALSTTRWLSRGTRGSHDKSKTWPGVSERFFDRGSSQAQSRHPKRAAR